MFLPLSPKLLLYVNVSTQVFMRQHLLSFLDSQHIRTYCTYARTLQALSHVVYVYILVCICTCCVCTYCVSIHMQYVRISTCVYTLYIYTDTYVYIYVRTYILYICIYVLSRCGLLESIDSNGNVGSKSLRY